MIVALSVLQVVLVGIGVWLAWSNGVLDAESAIRLTVLGSLALFVVNLFLIGRLLVRGISTKQLEWLPLLVGVAALILTPLGVVLVFLPLAALLGAG